MSELVPLREHPSNRDPTIRIVVERRHADGLDLIWSVGGGYLATLAGPEGLTFREPFASATEALAAIAARRAVAP